MEELDKIYTDKTITEEEAISLLKKYAPNEKVFLLVLNHSKNVQKIALKTAKKVKDINLDFIKTASLLHDIGRFSCPPRTDNSIRHGIVGYEILKKEGLIKHANVCRVHIGVGITKEDVLKQNLPLPKEDMIPLTKEEMIITYADNLDYKDEEKTEEWVENRFSEEIGEYYRLKVKKFHNKLHSLFDE
jgi:uncharacterized protein